MARRETPHEQARFFRLTDLKICTLCGALNAASNPECLVCRWHGRFEQRPEALKVAVEVLQRHYGRLDIGALTSEPPPTPATKRTFHTRLLRFLGHVRCWLFG